MQCARVRVVSTPALVTEAEKALAQPSQERLAQPFKPTPLAPVKGGPC